MRRIPDRTDWLVPAIAIAMCVASVAVPLAIWISHGAEGFWVFAVAGAFGLALPIAGSVLKYRAWELTSPPHLDDWGAQPPVWGYRRRRRHRKDYEP
jgi:hypothetical protein